MAFDILSHMRSQSSSAQEQKPEEKMTSTSSIFHKSPGICPKCHNPMINAKSHLDDDLYWCGMCRVSMPMPNDVK